MMNPESLDASFLKARFGCEFRAGEIIYQQGEVALRTYLLLEGRVRTTRAEAGSQSEVRVLTAGSLFGHCALLPNALRSTSAVALTPARALSFDEAALFELIGQHPEVALYLMQRLALISRELEDRGSMITVVDPSTRIVLALLQGARRNTSTAQEPVNEVTLDWSPIDMARRTGLDVATLKETLSLLHDRDYVAVEPRQLHILDIDALDQLYQLLEDGGQIDYHH